MSLRQLVDRWYWGAAPTREADRWPHFDERLRNLERILLVLHGAVEYPDIQYGARVAEASSGADTAITATSATNITGCAVTVTPDVDGTIVVHAKWLVKCTLFGGIAQAFQGGLSVNGTPESQFAFTSASALNDRRMIGQDYLVPVNSGTLYTLQLTGQTENAATTFDALKVHTGFIYSTVPNLYEVP